MDGISDSNSRQSLIDGIFNDLRDVQVDGSTISKDEIAQMIAQTKELAGADFADKVLNERDTQEYLSVAEKKGVGQEAVDAGVQIKVSEDLMSAKIILTPPKAGGKGVTEELILEKLRENNIIKGIKFEYIQRLLKHTVYHRPFKIASGQAPMPGEDASLQYCFEQVAQPTVFRSAEDYAKVHFTMVKAGDLLCEIKPATAGVRGWNIEGKTLEGEDGKSLGEVAGSNTVLTGNKLFANCDGMVSVLGSTVNVYRAETVQNMEYERLDFEGTVLVESNVTNSSILTAVGDIIVKGSVQNSQLSSGGDIIICKGVTGKGSTINAPGSVRTYFIENATVEAKKDIMADVVMRADIKCGGTLRLSGKRGNLLGGECQVGGSIYVNNMGNEANILTDVAITGSLRFSDEKQQIAEQIKDYRDKLKKLDQAIAVLTGEKRLEGEKKLTAIRLAYSKKSLEQEIEEKGKIFEEMCRREETMKSGKIVVRAKMYPNVSLNIDDVRMINMDERRYCEVTRKGSEIVFRPAMEGDL